MRLVLVLILAATAHAAERNTGELELIRKIPHTGYSEGLDFRDGYLWHALPKKIVKIDPKDGTVLETFKPATEYSESLTWMDGILWNVSFKDNGIYRGERKGKGFAFSRRGFTPEVHAWGLTNDGKHLIMTGDYSSKLYYFLPSSMKLVKTLNVNEKDLEDLAWDGKSLWTSSFTTLRSTIFRVDPETGKAGPYYTLPEPHLCPVVDGIAWDGKTLWITGKNCPAIWQVKRPSLRALSTKPVTRKNPQ